VPVQVWKSRASADPNTLPKGAAALRQFVLDLLRTAQTRDFGKGQVPELLREVLQAERNVAATCERNGANPFEYLTGLQRHAEGLKGCRGICGETQGRLAQPATA
jgi:hypothetical protein